MTRVIRIQNMEQADSCRPLIIARWPAKGAPFTLTLDPQREVTLSIHDGEPLVSIAKQAPGEEIAATITDTLKGADELEAKLLAVEAENQSLRADKDRLAAEVERLTAAAAERKPGEGDDDLAAQLAQALSDNKILADAYEKRFEELKAAEAKIAELQAATPAPLPTPEVKLESLTKAQLIDLATKRGIAFNPNGTKAELIAALSPQA